MMMSSGTNYNFVRTMGWRNKKSGQRATPMRLLHLVALSAHLTIVATLTDAYVPQLSSPRCCMQAFRTGGSSLYMAKKKGGLAFIAEQGGIAPSTTTTTTTPRKKAAGLKTTKKSATATATAATETPISPDLLKFMQSKESVTEQVSVGSNTVETATTSRDALTATASPSFVAFEPSSSSSSSRRAKQSLRQQMDEERENAVTAIVDEMQVVLANSGAAMVSSLVSLLRQLEEQQRSTSGMSLLKQLLTTKRRLDYRLAWVGSDAAVSHTGTGLHKVALARLQEVFLSLTGRNRLQYTEVIRILGPFPNVKNTLQGSSSVLSTSAAADDDASNENWKIVWDSMIDGTGKELLAGKAENTQTVLLNVCFCDERVLLATLPGKTILDDNGKHVLLFIRELSMDDKLEALRVA
jgi:hypothetical protein